MKNKKAKKLHPIQDEPIEILEATVVSVMHKQARVLIDHSVSSCLLPATLISGKDALVTGDKVEICPAGGEQYRLVKVLPRSTALYRGDRRNTSEEILIAANAQCLLAVVSASYLLHQAGYIEAALIAARRAGVEAVVMISKWDLIDPATQALLQDKLELYRSCCQLVYTGSALSHCPDLLKALQGKTTVVIGDRGCGKSTLIQSILHTAHGADLSKEPITSTHTACLYPLDQETLLIDTPGFREFALQQITEDERDTVFPEIAALRVGCSFGNCTHQHEEGCAVIEGLRTKTIKRERYDAYQKMMGTTPVAPKIDYRHNPCTESFTCKVCGTLITPEGAGSQHRNHCPKCLSSIHVDQEPGDRASLCKGVMEPVSVWVRKGGEWAIIHRCRLCGALSSNRIAADDNPALLMSIAVKPLAMTPFPLDKLGEIFASSRD